MAPQNKRQNTAKAPVVAKKAKVEATPEDPVITQLSPVFDALSASKLPPSCYQLLRVALPHCFRGTAEERHAYQLQVLDLASSFLKADEADKQASLKAAEEKVANLHAEIASSKTNMEAAKELVAGKLKELDEKNGQVTEATTEAEAAKELVAGKLKELDEKNNEVAAAAAEVEAFKSILTELWEPLKTSSFGSKEYRKRDKAIAQLIEKVAPVGIEECLLDAVVPALKQRQDKRETFAEFTLKCIVEQFERHQSLLAERAAATSEKEQELVKDAESKRDEKQTTLAARENEHMQLQNEWADLETAANQAAKALKEKESELTDADTEVTLEKAGLGAAIAITESFTKMKEQKESMVVNEPVAEVEAAPDVAASEVAAPEVAVSEAMETSEVPVVA